MALMSESVVSWLGRPGTDFAALNLAATAGLDSRPPCVHLPDRVAMVVADLGWVGLKFERSTLLPWRQAVGVHQLGLLPNLSQPNPDQQPLLSPCIISV